VKFWSHGARPGAQATCHGIGNHRQLYNDKHDIDKDSEKEEALRLEQKASRLRVGLRVGVPSKGVAGNNALITSRAWHFGIIHLQLYLHGAHITDALRDM
jgi:hypothetical protein